MNKIKVLVLGLGLFSSFVSQAKMSINLEKNIWANIGALRALFNSNVESNKMDVAAKIYNLIDGEMGLLVQEGKLSEKAKLSKLQPLKEKWSGSELKALEDNFNKLVKRHDDIVETSHAKYMPAELQRAREDSLEALLNEMEQAKEAYQAKLLEIKSGVFTTPSKVEKQGYSTFTKCFGAACLAAGAYAAYKNPAVAQAATERVKDVAGTIATGAKLYKDAFENMSKWGQDRVWTK